mmetsp:Transcript_12664/g.35129  ORF Transcript_12664/g.35129 Transcript_12664/m.35129 type:complete len:841 (-) Transcript_12664:186-2708(-)
MYLHKRLWRRDDDETNGMTTLESEHQQAGNSPPSNNTNPHITILKTPAVGGGPTTILNPAQHAFNGMTITSGNLLRYPGPFVHDNVRQQASPASTSLLIQREFQQQQQRSAQAAKSTVMESAVEVSVDENLVGGKHNRVGGVSNKMDRDGSTPSKMERQPDSKDGPKTQPDATPPTETFTIDSQPDSEELIQIQENDVVSGGRNVTVRNHPGNRRYIGLIRKFRQAYQSATKRIEKTNITKAVITIVENEFEGRFLKQNRSGKWVVLGEGGKHDKVSHALRIAVDPAFAIRKSRVGAEDEVDALFPDGFPSHNKDSTTPKRVADEKPTTTPGVNEMDDDKASALALLQLSQTPPTSGFQFQQAQKQQQQQQQHVPPVPPPQPNQHEMTARLVTASMTSLEEEQPLQQPVAEKPPTLQDPMDAAELRVKKLLESDLVVGEARGGLGINDVTCGERNLMARKHPGNHKYNELIQKYRMLYQNAERNNEKGRVTKLIIQTVEEYGGRFVKQRENGEWVEIDKSAKHDKVSHALRTAVDPNQRPKAKAAKDKKPVTSPYKETNQAWIPQHSQFLLHKQDRFVNNEALPSIQASLLLNNNILDFASQHILMKWCMEQIFAYHPPLPFDGNDLAVMVEHSERERRIGVHSPASRRAVLERFREKRRRRIQFFEALKKRDREVEPREESEEPREPVERVAAVSDDSEELLLSKCEPDECVANGPRRAQLQLGPNDVTCGGRSQSNTGNIRYQELVRAHREHYQNAKKNKEKTAITNRIIQTIELTGRFVKQDADGSWSEIDQATKRDKVSHALRSSGEAKKPRTPKSKPVNMTLHSENLSSPTPRYQ